ncbi:hypothetical protein ACOME3_004129 [Neoechinorhynchus agilis]
MFKVQPHPNGTHTTVINFVKVESIGRAILSLVHFIGAILFVVGLVRNDFKVNPKNVEFSGLFRQCIGDECFREFKPNYIRLTERLFATWAALAVIGQIYIILTAFTSIRTKKHFLSANTMDVLLAILIPIFSLATFWNLLLNSTYCGKHGNAFYMAYFGTFTLLFVYISIVFMTAHRKLMDEIIAYSAKKYEQMMFNSQPIAWSSLSSPQGIPPRLMLNDASFSSIGSQ